MHTRSARGDQKRVVGPMQGVIPSVDIRHALWQEPIGCPDLMRGAIVDLECGRVTCCGRLGTTAARPDIHNPADGSRATAGSKLADALDKRVSFLKEADAMKLVDRFFREEHADRAGRLDGPLGLCGAWPDAWCAAEERSPCDIRRQIARRYARSAATQSQPSSRSFQAHRICRWLRSDRACATARASHPRTRRRSRADNHSVYRPGPPPMSATTAGAGGSVRSITSAVRRNSTRPTPVARRSAS